MIRRTIQFGFLGLDGRVLGSRLAAQWVLVEAVKAMAWSLYLKKEILKKKKAFSSIIIYLGSWVTPPKMRQPCWPCLSDMVGPEPFGERMSRGRFPAGSDLKANPRASSMVNQIFLALFTSSYLVEKEIAFAAMTSLADV